MIKTLTKHGNSCALVIDKPILDLLHIKPDTPLELTTDGCCLVITPIRKPADERKFQKAMENIHTRIGRAMKKLAE